MREKPILFNGEMVRAILDGRKTQTRRVLKPKQIPKLLETAFDRGEDGEARYMSEVQGGRYGFGAFGETEEKCVKELLLNGGCPFGWKEDQLWVREKLKWEGYACKERVGEVWYCADNADVENEWPSDWVPPINSTNTYQDIDDNLPAGGIVWHDGHVNSIFMPRWASRIQLEVTNIRVERVQDISEKDAMKEGVTIQKPWIGVDTGGEAIESETISWSPTDYFANLWDSINLKRGYSWDSNPWVWVVEFEVINK